jgi:hypothetical protein
MRRFHPFALAVSILWSSAAGAQLPDWVTQVINAAQLPVSAAEARTEGVADSTVRAVLDAMKNANVPASEAKDMLDTARKVHKEHGPVDNFGAFVQSKLQAGLRGRELAAAIKAEHQARGKGHAGQAKGKAGERGGKADTDTLQAGRGKAGRPDRPANPGTKGRPDKPSR